MRLISLFVTATTLLSPFIHADDGALVSTLTNIPSRILTNPAVASSITTNAKFKDLIVNIGKLYVDAEIEFDGQEQEQEHDGKKPYTQPSTGGGKKPVKVHDEEETPSAQDTSTDIDWAALFPELELSAEPAADEVVLGETNSTDVSVQGGEKEVGIIAEIGPQIFSVTFKILQSKMVTIAGADLTDSADVSTSTNYNEKPQKKKKELVTFVIRGQGFTVGGTQNFNSIFEFLNTNTRSIDSSLSGLDGIDRELLRGQQDGLGSFLAPRVFIGAIPLQVVQFTDTLIVARFLDLEDQRSFQPGAFVVRVKVLRFSQRVNQKDGHDHGDIGVLGGEDGVAVSTGIVAPTVLVGGLALPALGAVGGSFLSGPILPISGGKNDGLGGLGGPLGGIGGHGAKQNAVTTGLEFFTAVLTVQFSVNDALAIRNSVPILDTWYD